MFPLMVTDICAVVVAVDFGVVAIGEGATVSCAETVTFGVGEGLLSVVA